MSRSDLKAQWLSLFLAGLALVGSAYVEYTHNDRANATAIGVVANDVAALKAHRADDAEQLSYIRNRVDWLVQHIKTKE